MNLVKKRKPKYGYKLDLVLIIPIKKQQLKSEN